jgi:predicted nucleic acid-binding protein
VKFLLDTNIYFAAIHEPGYFDRHRPILLRIGPLTHLSSVVRFELLQGAKGAAGRERVSKATHHLERVGRVVSPTHADWVTAGTIQGRIWDRDRSVRDKRLQNDILIVCGARRIGAIIITDNVDDFQLIATHLPHTALSMQSLARAIVGPAPYARRRRGAVGSISER